MLKIATPDFFMREKVDIKEGGNGSNRRPTQGTKVYPGDVALVSLVEERFFENLKKSFIVLKT